MVNGVREPRHFLAEFHCTACAWLLAETIVFPASAMNRIAARPRIEAAPVDHNRREQKFP